jgi:PAS domain S-box-containing protein
MPSRLQTLGQLEKALEAMSEGFVIFDAEDRLTYCNSKFREMFSGASDLIERKPAFDEWARACAERGLMMAAVGREEEWIAERIKEHREGFGPRDHQLRDGRWVRITEYKTESGGTAGLRVDVTDRKQAEDALRAAEARFAGILTVAPQAIISTDESQCIRLFNLGAEKVFGYSADEATGQTLDLLLPARFRETHHKHIEEFVNSSEASRMMDRRPEIVGLRKDGTEFPAEACISKLELNGDVILTAVLRDITERKQAEHLSRQLTAIIETTDDAVILETRDGTILHWNEGAERLYGYSRDEMLGKSATMLSLPEPNEVSDIIKHINKGERLGNYEAVHRIKDGSLIDVSITVSAVTDEHGNVTGISAIVRDITELKRTREQLQQAQKMESMGQLTSGVAHDFNNLLAVVMGNTELLEDRLGSDDKPLNAILRAATRGAELTERLLAFSRQQPLRPQVIDLGELVSGMSGLLTRTLGEAIDIETKAAPGLWDASADPGQVENALLNLALNARDAMPGGGKLTIGCENAHLDKAYAAQNPEVVVGDYAVLAVSDNGTGMSAEVQAHAFEPFYTTKDVGQGSGLGLSMVYGFAKQSGGHASIYSNKGQGTTVKLYLPRAGEAPQSEKAHQDADVPRGRGEVVLVIEDDPDVRDFAVQMLKGLGYRVIEVPDAAKARKLLAEGTQVDLVLSDVVLPGGLSGPEFAEEARTTHPDLKVIFMSGYLAEAAKRNGFLGSDKVLLAKPFQRQQLAKALREALD